MAKENQNAAIEQNTEVQSVGAVVTLETTKPQANDSGKDAPATIAGVRQVFAVDVEKFRKAFADSAKADVNAKNKTAVCAELFVPISLLWTPVVDVPFLLDEWGDSVELSPYHRAGDSLCKCGHDR